MTIQSPSKARTLGDVIDWCWANKRGLAFVDYTFEQVATKVLRAHKQGHLYLAENDDGLLIGVVIARPEIYVSMILTVDRAAVPIFLQQASIKHPGIPISGTKRGRKVTYGRFSR